jgi:hypothetical protein
MHARVHRGHRRSIGETGQGVFAGGRPMDIDADASHYEVQETVMLVLPSIYAIWRRHRFAPRIDVSQDGDAAGALRPC